MACGQTALRVPSVLLCAKLDTVHTVHVCVEECGFVWLAKTKVWERECVCVCWSIRIDQQFDHLCILKLNSVFTGSSEGDTGSERCAFWIQKQLSSMPTVVRGLPTVPSGHQDGQCRRTHLPSTGRIAFPAIDILTVSVKM